MTKELSITLSLENGIVSAYILEPESGDTKMISNYYSPNEHREFDDEISQEIYSWFELMADEEE